VRGSAPAEAARLGRDAAAGLSFSKKYRLASTWPTAAP
jgi:hypothetical protein